MEELKEEIRVLTARLDRLEDALDLRGVVPKPIKSIAPVEHPKTEAVSTSWSPLDGIGYIAYVTYQCRCGKIHASNEIIKAVSKDGLYYTIKGSCDQLTSVRITKHKDSDKCLSMNHS